MDTTAPAGTSRYLTFTLGDETFALDIGRVREVLDYRAVTAVPLNPEFLRGVIDLRGAVLPVVDLRLRFGMTRTERSKNTRVIITEIAVNGETTLLGALADSVQGVVGLDADGIEPAPRIGTKLNTDYLKGMGTKNGRFVLVLDVDRVFSDEWAGPIRPGEPVH